MDNFLQKHHPHSYTTEIHKAKGHEVGTHAGPAGLLALSPDQCVALSSGFQLPAWMTEPSPLLAFFFFSLPFLRTTQCVGKETSSHIV